MVALAGCSGGNIETTATGGVGGRVGDIVLRDAQFTFDGPSREIPCTSPATMLRCKSPSSTRVTAPTGWSPSAARSRARHHHRRCQDSGYQVLAAGYQAPLASTHSPRYRRRSDRAHRLRSPISAGLDYPVVFDFEHAGELRLELPVENPSAQPTP